MLHTKVNPFVNSAFAPPSVMIMRHGGYAESMDCSTPALDLCVRNKKRSPSPEGAQMVNREVIYRESPSSSYPSPESQYCDSSGSSDSYPVTTSPVSKPKIPRPFKAYPKDPLSLTLGVVSTEALLNHDTAEAYNEFRNKMLAQVQSQHQGTNKNMRRNTLKTGSVNDDPSYWEKRKKNNEAAKRSRDARRAKEDEIAIRCAFLEQENLKLKYQNVAFKNEIERLRNML